MCDYAGIILMTASSKRKIFSVRNLTAGLLVLLTARSWLVGSEGYTEKAEKCTNLSMNLTSSSQPIPSLSSQPILSLSSPQIGTTAYFQSICHAAHHSEMLQLPLQCEQSIQTKQALSKVELLKQLDCKHFLRDEKNFTINFYAFAHGHVYAAFLPLYAFFAISSSSHNNAITAMVEMVVDDPEGFIDAHHTELGWLESAFPNSICVRNATSQIQPGVLPNTQRYIEPPAAISAAKYTYIADIDIFLLDSPMLDTKRFAQMKHFEIPYSNIVRGGTTKLTGVMLVHTQNFYTPALLQAQQTIPRSGNDEAYLYRLVVAAGHGLPINAKDFKDKLATYRPVHGLHLSPSRGPGKRMCLEKLTSWCRCLAMPLLDEMLCAGSWRILQQFLVKTIQQEESNMTVVKEICS